MCINTPGSYQCSCDGERYTLNSDGYTCDGNNIYACALCMHACVCMYVCICVRLTVVHDCYIIFHDQILMNVVLQLVVLLAVSIPASILTAATTAHVTLAMC